MGFFPLDLQYGCKAQSSQSLAATNATTTASALSSPKQPYRDTEQCARGFFVSAVLTEASQNRDAGGVVVLKNMCFCKDVASKLPMSPVRLANFN